MNNAEHEYMNMSPSIIEVVTLYHRHMSARLENGQYLLGMLYTLISPELMLLDWNFGQNIIEIMLLTFIAIFTNTLVYTAISIKVVPEQSAKVEYERERLLGIANKRMNLLAIPSSLSRSYSTFPLCSGDNLN